MCVVTWRPNHQYEWAHPCQHVLRKNQAVNFLWGSNRKEKKRRGREDWGRGRPQRLRTALPFSLTPLGSNTSCLALNPLSWRMETFRYMWEESAYTYLHPYWRSSVETKARQSVTTRVGRGPLAHLTHPSPPEPDSDGQTQCCFTFWEICFGSQKVRERFTLPTLDRISPYTEFFYGIFS